MGEKDAEKSEEKNLDKLRRSLTAAKTWVSRSHKTLSILLTDNTLDNISVQEAISSMEKKLCTFDEVQGELELAVPEAEMVDCIDSAADFRDSKLSVLLQGRKLLLDNEDNVSSASRSNVSEVPLNVHLPKLDIGKFSGDIIEWTPFWEKFSALIGDKPIPTVSKFSYLLSALEGEAKGVIQGLSVTESNYSVACQLLQDRFGRTEQIRFAHIQALLNFAPMPRGQKGSRVSSLWTWKDTLLSHIRSLEGLGIKGEMYGIFLTPIILSRLPHDMRMEWAREGEGKEADLEFLLESLTKEIRRLERSESFKEQGTSSSVSIEERGTPKKKNTVSALHVASAPAKMTCLYCEKSHPSHKCRKVRSLQERQSKVRELGLCFRCLGTSHLARSCSKLCSDCNGFHHVSLCYRHAERGGQSSSGDKAVFQSPTSTQTRDSHAAGHSSQASEEQSDATPDVSLMSAGGSCQTRTALPIIQVVVASCHDKVVKANLLLDSGSDKTYVSSALVQEIQPEFVGTESIQYAAFGEDKRTSGLKNVYSLNVQGTKKGKGSVIAIEVPTICTPMCRPTIPLSKLSSFQSVQLIDTGIEEGKPFTIDILVGLDHYWKFVQGGVLPGIDGLVAQETIFGWMVTGSWESSVSAMCLSAQLLCIHDIPESTVRNLWSLESVGISAKENEDSLDNDPVLSHFSENVKMVEGRYEVALPWNRNKCDLLDNEHLANKRLMSLNRRLDLNPELKESYNSVFVDYESQGFIEEVSSECSTSQPVYYMPHHPVVKEHSTSTKVRPVFDASAVGVNGISLNDCMEAGPSLIPSLVEVLLRFRRWNVALSADITKAFLQVSVREEDRNAHMFLWDVNGQMKKMRFTRVPFGNKCSPFLLNATIQHHLSSMSPSKVVTELSQNLYVDDWLSGADREDEAEEMLNEAQRVMSKAGMNLTKWHSNKLCLDVGEKEQGASSVKVLGIGWEGSNDCFHFAESHLPPLEGLTCTKRGILSLTARIFDPLGFLTPLTMFGKFIFQDLWCLGVGWDEEVPEQHQKRFVSWVRGLQSVSQLHIPRCLCLKSTWKEASEGLEIHAFGDASMKGYGAVVYCRVPRSEGGYQVSLVMSKGKVAPLKKITLPRLELLGALLCARLVVFVLQALKLSLDSVNVSCWTDSMIALGWIKGESSRWKQFVANRVHEIQELTDPSCWRHCASEENPADVVSRGLTGPDLTSCKLWWYGPHWLAAEVNSNESCSEIFHFPLEEQNVVCTVSSHAAEEVVDVSRFSSLDKALKVVGWILRFLSNVRNNHSCNLAHLTLEELSDAKAKLLFLAQASAYADDIHRLKSGLPTKRDSCLRKLNPFIGPDGLLRVGGRLGRSDLEYEEKYPVILPKCHLSLLLVRSQHVRHKHAGVDTMICMLRGAYWIVGLRRLAKRVKRECVSCQKQDGLAFNQPCGPLPALRVKDAPPFSVTGLDFAGPLYACDLPGKKLYFLLLTCAVVRAVHVELVDSMAVDDCVMAIRRFCARRGMVNTFYSDNAKTFVGVSKLMHSVFGTNAPGWRFIAPRSPWWGGWWERLVRSVKSGLRKSIGGSCLTRAELETSLMEIEACVNSRPLTFVGDDSDSLTPLTPSHFLIGRSAGFQGVMTDGNHPPSLSPSKCRERFEIMQQRMKLFWSRWSKEYLRSLPPTVPNSKVQGKLKLGSVVLIKEDNIPKIRWPLGRVIELHPGKDDIVRSVSVKTAKGVIKRSIQCLRDLEIAPENVPLLDQEKQIVESVAKSRYGRTLKPVVKYT